MPATFFLVSCKFYKRVFLKLGIFFFYFTSKALSILIKSDFKILFIQISLCHEMPKHKTRNTLYWITWGKNTVIGEIWPYQKRKKFIEKFHKKLWPENYFQAFSCFQRVKHNLYCKMKFLKQASYIWSVIAKITKTCSNQHADLLRFNFREDS